MTFFYSRGIAALRRGQIPADAQLDVIHHQRGVDRYKDQKDGVDQQIGQMKVLAVRVPLHLQILLAQRMSEQLHATVCDHGLAGKEGTRTLVSETTNSNTQRQKYRVYNTVTTTGTTTVRTGTVGDDDLVSSQNTIAERLVKSRAALSSRVLTGKCNWAETCQLLI